MTMHQKRHYTSSVTKQKVYQKNKIKVHEGLQSHKANTEVQREDGERNNISS